MIGLFEKNIGFFEHLVVLLLTDPLNDVMTRFLWGKTFHKQMFFPVIVFNKNNARLIQSFQNLKTSQNWYKLALGVMNDDLLIIIYQDIQKIEYSSLNSCYSQRCGTVLVRLVNGPRWCGEEGLWSRVVQHWVLSALSSLDCYITVCVQREWDEMRDLFWSHTLWFSLSCSGAQQLQTDSSGNARRNREPKSRVELSHYAASGPGKTACIFNVLQIRNTA